MVLSRRSGHWNEKPRNPLETRFLENFNSYSEENSMKQPSQTKHDVVLLKLHMTKLASQLLDQFWARKHHLPHTSNASGNLWELEGAESNLCPWPGPQQMNADLLMRNATKTAAQHNEVIACSWYSWLQLSLAQFPFEDLTRITFDTIVLPLSHTCHRHVSPWFFFSKKEGEDRGK